MKSLKRQIFRYGGNNILGVYQNKSDLFQVCEQVLLFYYFGSVATHGHIASKRKRPATFASHSPHTCRESGVLDGPSGTTHSLGKACCLAFSLSCGTAVEQTDYWQTAPRPPPGWKTETRGRSSYSTEAKKFGVRWGSLIE